MQDSAQVVDKTINIMRVIVTAERTSVIQFIAFVKVGELGQDLNALMVRYIHWCTQQHDIASYDQKFTF